MDVKFLDLESTARSAIFTPKRAVNLNMEEPGRLIVSSFEVESHETIINLIEVL